MKGIYLISIWALYFLLVSFFVIHFDIGYILSMLLYFGLPSIYFSFKKPSAITQNLFYAFSFSVPITVVLDYIAHVSNAWYVFSIFSIRMLDAFPVEEILWTFLFFYVILSAYTGIWKGDHHFKNHPNNNKYIAWIIFLTMPIFFLIWTLNKELLIITHFYILMVITIMVIPSIGFLYSFDSHQWRKVLLLTLAFTVFFLFFYEYSALKTGQWIFSGDYIGWIKLLGVQFPVEELLFAIFSVPGTIGAYEFFRRQRNYLAS